MDACFGQRWQEAIDLVEKGEWSRSDLSECVQKLCSGLFDQQLAVSVHVICSHRYVATNSHLRGF